MTAAVSITNLSKTYATGFTALKGVDLEVRKGEIFALLGPNGAGKTTLIGIVCGIVNATGGTVLVSGHDVVSEYRKTRSLIGLVPQEVSIDAFESVWNTVSFSRGLFGKGPNPAHIEKVLKSLSLWDKKDEKVLNLSGGMKRRVLIAKALSHEPEILFLDEPTAGVDVELRRDMWEMVRGLRETGVTIILTTHYIEEAEEMADRIGVINHGEISWWRRSARSCAIWARSSFGWSSCLRSMPSPRRLPGAGWSSPMAAPRLSIPTTPMASAPVSPRCWATSIRPACASATWRRARARSRKSSSIW